MLEFSWYSVISPRAACDPLETANEQTNTAAADSLKLTARQPLPGHHRRRRRMNPSAAPPRPGKKMGQNLERHGSSTNSPNSRPIKPTCCPRSCYERFRRLRAFAESAAVATLPPESALSPLKTAVFVDSLRPICHRRDDVIHRPPAAGFSPALLLSASSAHATNFAVLFGTSARR